MVSNFGRHVGNTYMVYNWNEAGAEDDMTFRLPSGREQQMSTIHYHVIVDGDIPRISERPRPMSVLNV